MFAYERGGTSATGLVGLVLLVPAAVVAPVAGALGDRLRRERVAAWGYAGQAVCTGAVAVAMLADAPDAVVYTMAAVAMAVFTTGRPGHHSLLPSVSRSPEELAAGNSVSALAEGVGGALGTVAVTVLLAVSSAGVAYLAMAVVSVLGAGIALTVHLPRERRIEGGRGSLHLWALAGDAFAAMLVVGRSSGPRLLIGIAASVTLVSGIFDVLLVSLAIDRLDLGEAGVGVLQTSLGAGALIGAGGSMAFVGRRKLSVALVAGGLALGASVALAGLAEDVAVAIAAGAAFGASLTLMDVVGRTLLQRVVADALLTRVFGAVETLWMLGVGVGAAVGALLVSAFGLTTAFLVGGAIVPGLVLVAFRGLRVMERRVVVPERQLRVLSELALFAALPRTDLERVAGQLDLIPVRSGEVVIRQGDVGDRFYAVDAGRFEVLEGDRRVAILGEGDGFGEIALLRDVPRTATVRSLDAGAVWALDRDEFLATVTGLPGRDVDRATSCS